MSISLFVGVPVVALCYILVNTAFFIVLSYEEILKAEAVALVSNSGQGFPYRVLVALDHSTCIYYPLMWLNECKENV